MNVEQPLKRACTPRLIGAGDRRIQGQSELSCHAWINDPLRLAAALQPSSRRLPESRRDGIDPGKGAVRSGRRCIRGEAERGRGPGPG